MPLETDSPVLETSWFEEAVATDAFSIWFQPVVDTTVRRIIGHECLIRLTAGHHREGAEVMVAASAHHATRTFDSYTRQLAIRAISAQPDSRAACFLNFVPSTIGEPSELLTGTSPNQTCLNPGDIVMEATGCNRNPDIAHLRRIGDYLRDQCFGFSLDDVSDSAEALRLVCDVRPDYIKLEKRLVIQMIQPRHEAAVRKLVEVADRLGVRVIAKGVERVATMEYLWECGIQCMQGYLFGCPSPEMSIPVHGNNRVFPFQILERYHASPVLTNLNKKLLSAIGIP
jgi:EAL domain-containing protein (putative c-di-GMP-specific phosphodiesterase class I)